MQIIPLTIAEAEEFLAKHERHYKTPATPIAAVGVGEYEEVTSPATPPKMKVHGAAVLGKNPSGDAELSHIYADGASQGYTLLYGAAWRALKALGYTRTYL